MKAGAFENKTVLVRLIGQELRIYQWVKNLLVFLPMLSAFDFTNALEAFLAFGAFSCCASSIYVINDLFDLEADRQHHRKRSRPFASGQLPLSYAPWLYIPSLLFSFLLALKISFPFFSCIIAYLGISLAYNLILKKKALLDVFCLSFLFLLRIYAGSVATSVTLTPWFMNFAFFFFTSLAFLKRFTEFSTEKMVVSRGYSSNDAEFMGILGISTAGISVVILSLYLNAPQVKELYKQPELLWFLVPILFLWISRAWLKGYRKEMHDDPVVFALHDKASRYLLAATLLIILFSH